MVGDASAGKILHLVGFAQIGECEGTGRYQEDQGQSIEGIPSHHLCRYHHRNQPRPLGQLDQRCQDEGYREQRDSSAQRFLQCRSQVALGDHVTEGPGSAEIEYDDPCPPGGGLDDLCLPGQDHRDQRAQEEGDVGVPHEPGRFSD